MHLLLALDGLPDVLLAATRSRGFGGPLIYVIRRNMTKRSAFAAPLVKASEIVEMYHPSGSGRSARLAPH